MKSNAEKSTKIVINLAWDKKLVLEPTVENMQFAIKLTSLQTYSEEYFEGKTTYYHSRNGDNIHSQIVVADVFEGKFEPKE